MSLTPADLYGIPIKESPRLKYDEMYVSPGGAGLVVGEARHLIWRIEMYALNEACRALAEQNFEDAWWRILGEKRIPRN